LHTLALASFTTQVIKRALEQKMTGNFLPLIA